MKIDEAMQKRTKVLIVDDDKMFGHVVRTYLDEAGYLTTIVHSGDRVLENIKSGCDLVLLDLYMVGKTGVDILIAIKDEFPDLPVIVMTGFSSNELRQTTESLGACAYLDKPFAMSALKKAIDGLLITIQ